MDYHHVVEAAGAVALALVFYSYTWRWFDAAESPRRARWRPMVNGIAFGLLAVFLMMSRIQVSDGQWVDARAVPLALITLMEGTPAGAIAGGIALARRLWLGGAGALAGAVGIVAVVAAAAAVRAWAKRDGGVGFRHSLTLAIAVYAITYGSFLVLGRRGAALFAHVWLPVLLLNLVGIGLVARLFSDVVAGRAAEAARRDAAQLRAVTLLARAAAHEINNPLTAVLGGLGLVARRLTPDTEEAKWVERAREGGERIRDIVARMNRITQVEEAPQIGALPPILDLKKSSE
ncbi:MAG TPA: LytS/YhcK type 5TM receptor domain-containing protein [Patescibacteria group bacterium]|nr:LytS/YhcK type 5TM receptor domain-containing protein [Patescibacteria group bacterium]